jgi:hypothetical protein
VQEQSRQLYECPSSPVSGAGHTNVLSQSEQNDLDDRYHRFRELLQNLNDREEELKQRWLQKDHILDRFYEQLLKNYKDIIDQEKQQIVQVNE